MGPVLIGLLVVLFSLIAYAVHQTKKKYKFWEEKGVPYAKPVLFFGSSAPLLFMRKNFSSLHREIARQFPNEPLVGYFDYTKPVLMVKDHEMIEKVLIKDFMHFVDRGFPLDRRNAVDISLFSLTGKEWRALRYKLSPLFTTTKLKHMYGSMTECGDGLTTLLDKEKSEEVYMRDILGRFAMDVIGSCAFGLDTQNLKQADNEFRKMGKKAFQFNYFQLMKMLFMLAFPKVAKLFRFSFTRPDVAKYFCNIIKDTVEYRKKNNVVRNDFLQSLMILKDKGIIELQIKDPIDDYLKMDTSYTIESFEINEDTMVGQAFTFLTAGFEATALTTMFALYELAKNLEIQDKVRKEILKQVEVQGSLTYDAVKQMTYLEQCAKETLRKYPPAVMIMRVCTKEYTFPNGPTVLPGQSLVIPLGAVHHDPKYYPEPETFRPERFDPDVIIPSCAYLPFGNGPRICIAMRFALMEINYCLAKLLMKYEFRISPKTKPFEMAIKSFLPEPKHPIYFDITKISAAI